MRSKNLAKALSKQKIFAFDTETTGLDVMTAELVGMSFSWQSGEAHYVPVGHIEGEQLSAATVLDVLGPILESPLLVRWGTILSTIIRL
jgi:DNA polymerase-1